MSIQGESLFFCRGCDYTEQTSAAPPELHTATSSNKEKKAQHRINENLVSLSWLPISYIHRHVMKKTQLNEIVPTLPLRGYFHEKLK